MKFLELSSAKPGNADAPYCVYSLAVKDITFFSQDKLKDLKFTRILLRGNEDDSSRIHSLKEKICNLSYDQFKELLSLAVRGQSGIYSWTDPQGKLSVLPLSSQKNPHRLIVVIEDVAGTKPYLKDGIINPRHITSVVDVGMIEVPGSFRGHHVRVSLRNKSILYCVGHINTFMKEFNHAQENPES